MGAHVGLDPRTGRYFVRGYENGSDRKLCVGPDEANAREKADAINTDFAARQAERDAAKFTFPRDEPISASRALRHWFATHKFKKSTTATVRGALESHLIPHFGPTDLRMLTRTDIRHYSSW